MGIRYDVLTKNLPLSDKEELKNLIEKYIIEEKRDIIHQNYLKG